MFGRVSTMVGTSGLEPPTSRLSGVCSNQLSYVPFSVYLVSLVRILFPSCNVFRRSGGGKRDRTADPLLARQVLSQLSYTPVSTLTPFFRLGKTKAPFTEPLFLLKTNS